jgi:alpha-L-rhamnosidase
MNKGRKTFGVVGLLSLVIFPVLLGAVFAAADITPVEPRVEYSVNPLGIDTVQPRLSWKLTATQRAQKQTAYQVLVASTDTNLAANIGDQWDSGKIASDETVGIVYGGSGLLSNKRYYWKVRVWDQGDNISSWSASAWWEMGLLGPGDWQGKWIGTNVDKESPLFRKEFTIAKTVKKATAYVYGLGWYEMRLNGAKVGDRVLTPANTSYTQLNLYDSYDVTAYLRNGGNAVGLWLGDGYNGNYSIYGWRWQDAKRAILQMNIDFTDNSSMSVVTDETWRAADSPVTVSHIYDGETYDARLEKTGWDTYGYNAGSWEAVKIMTAPGGVIASNRMPPIRVVRTVRPVSMSQPQSGVYVFDMGQNFAGWTRLHVQGNSGVQLVLKHSELIGGNGMIDPWTNRNAKATDTYILKGAGPEVYEPRFTYHGFRYVEVTGFPGTPTLDSIEGCVVHSDVESTGSFSCSNSLLNQIQSNFRWGIQSNLMSIPTDCCQRDERTPCQMDSICVEETAINNFQMDQYYTKWLRDIKGGRGNPDWNGDQVFPVWYLYQYYADKRILEQNYDNMKGFVDYLHTQAPGHIWTNGYGDWCAPNIDTWDSYFNDVEVVNTALYYQMASIVSQAAGILGKPADATYYSSLAAQIKTACNSQLLNQSTNLYGDGSQTTALLPLAFGMAPADRQGAIVNNLVRNIMEEKSGHLDTGIFGTKYLVEVLADYGEADVAYTVLNQTTYPGFGDQINQGATTLWEQWYFKGGMDSHNHAMFGGTGASFYTRLGGIQPLSPGYKTISIKPYRPNGLTYVNSSVETVRGLVTSNWRLNGNNTFNHEITIPVNCTATVYIPAQNIANVTESGNPIGQAVGVAFLRMEGGYAVLSVDSGSFSFASSALPTPTPSPTPTPLPPSLFADDFSGDLSKWTNTTNASIVSGQLSLSNNEIMRNAGGSGWTNYALEADVKITSCAAGLVFRSVDSNNYYMWQLNALNGGKLRPHKKVGGTWSTIKEVTTGTVANTMYHLKIEANGATIKTYIDGVLVDTTIDTAFSSGNIGFRMSYSGSVLETAVFDNIVVRAIGAASPTPTATPTPTLIPTPTPTSTPTLTPAPTPLFSDDFSGDLSKWANTANCSISGGQLNVANNETMCSVSGSGWTNYSLEADVKITNVAAGLVFRSGDSNNCYMWQLSALNGGKLRPHKKVGGTWSIIKEVNTGTVVNTTYHIKIEANGSTIKTYLGGSLVDTTTDTTFGSGKIGFRQSGADSETAVIDNVMVKGL